MFKSFILLRKYRTKIKQLKINELDFYGFASIK